MLGRQIKELGVKVTIAADGLDALMLAARDTPDLMILNVNLPGASGLQICETLRRNQSTSAMAVIFLTDRSDEDSVRRCSALGVQYVFKDLTYWDQLQPMIREHLDIAPADQTASGNGAPGQGTEQPGGPRILVIDDDPQVTRGLAIRLGALGFNVIQAANASGGTYLAWTERPDLIITDQNMPEMTGESLIVKLKNDPETKDIPIVVITGQKVGGKEDFGLKRNMLGLRGAVAYLTKPVDFNELVAVLRSHIPAAPPQSRKPDSATPANSPIRSNSG